MQCRFEASFIGCAVQDYSPPARDPLGGGFKIIEKRLFQSRFL
jgi:hypothetical protein